MAEDETKHKDLAGDDLHPSKPHTLDSHSEKKLNTLDEKTPGVGVTVDGCLIKDGKAADSSKLEGSTKGQVRDHDPKAHGHSLLHTPGSEAQGGDISGTVGNAKVEKLQTKAVPAPTDGDHGKALKWNKNEGHFEYGEAGGGAKPDFIIDIPAGAWDYPMSNPAPLDTDVGTNGTIKRNLFDDTTEEFVIAQIKLPSDLNAAGTVYFEAYGYAVTAAANKNIALTLYHDARGDSEGWDDPYSSKASGDLACDAVQDDLDHFSWSETVANLGWAAGDLVRIKLSRTAPTTDNLPGDWGLVHFRIRGQRS